MCRGVFLLVKLLKRLRNVVPGVMLLLLNSIHEGGSSTIDGSHLLTITPASSAVLPGAVFIGLRALQHLHHQHCALADAQVYIRMVQTHKSRQMLNLLLPAPLTRSLGLTEHGRWYKGPYIV